MPFLRGKPMEKKASKLPKLVSIKFEGEPQENNVGPILTHTQFVIAESQSHPNQPNGACPSSHVSSAEQKYGALLFPSGFLVDI